MANKQIDKYTNNQMKDVTRKNPAKQDLAPQDEVTIILFFLPQLLEWMGFFLLPIPFLFFQIKNGSGFLNPFSALAPALLALYTTTICISGITIKTTSKTPNGIRFQLERMINFGTNGKRIKKHSWKTLPIPPHWPKEKEFLKFILWNQ